ncbi:MAG: S-layer homology domain-containing protein, partial [Actinomycetota bacterium]
LSFNTSGSASLVTDCWAADWSIDDPVLFPWNVSAGNSLFLRVAANDTTTTSAFGRIGVVEMIDGDAGDDFADAIAMNVVTGAVGERYGLLGFDTTDGVLTSEAGDGEPHVCGTRALETETTWASFTPPAGSGTRAWSIDLEFVDIGGDWVDVAVYDGSAIDDLDLLGCIRNRATQDTTIVTLTEGVTYPIQIGIDDMVNYSEFVLRATQTSVRTDPVRPDVDDPDATIATFSDITMSPEGDPVVVYDATLSELRVATRVDDVWSTETLFGGDFTSAHPSIITLANNGADDAGYAIAYKASGDLYLVRGNPGDWETPEVVDTGSGIDGGPPSINVGHESSIVEFADGRLAVLHLDYQNKAVRLAVRSTDGIWTREEVLRGSGFSLSNESMRIDADETLHIAVTDAGGDRAQYLSSTDAGATWTSADTILTGNGDPEALIALAPDDTVWVLTVAYEDGGPIAWQRTGAGAWTAHHIAPDARFTVARASMPSGWGVIGFEIDGDGHPWAAWRDQYWSGLTVVRRVATGSGGVGTWHLADLVGDDPGANAGALYSGGFGYGAEQAGFTLTDDDRPVATYGVRTGTTGDMDLSYAEDTLQAMTAAESIDADAGQVINLSGAGIASTTPIASFTWSVPAGCSGGGTSASPNGSIICTGAVDDEISLTATDTDGWSHTATIPITVHAPPEPPPTTTVPPTTTLPPEPEPDDDIRTRVFICPETTTPFEDLPGNWADAAIACIYGLGVTTGTSATTYGPTGHVTRMQMAAFMSRLYETMTGTECEAVATPFEDLPGNWADAAIACIYGLGVTTGTSATTYDPNGRVTRMQMAAFLDRLWTAIRLEQAPTPESPFVDLPGNWADAAIARVYGLGITTGTSATTYDPNGLVTRMQMAAFIARFYEAVPPA